MNSLAIRIELRKSDPPAGVVVIENQGRSDVLVWRMGNSWGDETLSFEVTADGRTERVTRKPGTYTWNTPTSMLLAPGNTYGIPFDLGDGSWHLDTAAAQLRAPGAQLGAVYKVRDTPEARAQKVWTGRLRSGLVPLR